MENAPSANRAERLLINQPRINAVAVEGVSTPQYLHRVALVELAKTHSTRWTLLDICGFPVPQRKQKGSLLVIGAHLDLFHVVLSSVALDVFRGLGEEEEDQPASPHDAGHLPLTSQMSSYREEEQDVVPKGVRLIYA